LSALQAARPRDYYWKRFTAGEPDLSSEISTIWGLGERVFSKKLNYDS
jgi:hypothetical protein